jgi:hypothetical protein
MASKEEVYEAVVGFLVRPVARFCVRNSIPFRVFFEHARMAFVREANAFLEGQGQSANVSRVALRTGLSRREVQACLSNQEVEAEPSLLRKILGKWQLDKRYRAKSGRPRPLTALGNDSEFAEMVRSVSQDLNPYSVLGELESAKLVERKDAVVTLVSPVYIPAGDIKRGFQLVASDVDDLVLAAEENIEHQENPPHLHIKTSYDNIDVRALPEIREWCIKKGQEIHAEAREFFSRYDLDMNPQRAKGGEATGGARVALGTFSIAQQPDIKASSEPEKTDPITGLERSGEGAKKKAHRSGRG